MNNIKLIPYNETYVQISVEDSTARDLNTFFTIKIPNPQFRKKGWNGTIKLFNLKTRLIYKGLIPYIADYANEHNYDFDSNGLDTKNEISIFETREFAKSLQLVSDYKPIEPHTHQINAVTQALRCKRLLIVSPTASGKSLILYMIVRSILKYTKKKILIIVPTTNLVSQLYGDFRDYSTLNKWNVMMNCNQIYGFDGVDKSSNKPVYISTWQSLYTQPKEYFEQFGCVLGDEAHLYASKSLQHILGSCINAKYRIGTTGTLNDTKTHILTLQGLFGSIYKPTTTEELIREKKLSQFQIKCIILKHPPCEPMKYHDELQYLIENQNRNKFIRNLAMSLENNTLILYQYVEKHGLILKDMLEKVNNEKKKKIYFISGKVDNDIRESIRRIVEKETNAIIVASYGTFSFGSNIKNLHNIIFASPSKGRVRVLQSIGRELRLHESKKISYLFDISDNLVYNAKQQNFTYDHFLARLKIYHEEKFPYKIYKVALKENI